MSCSTFLKVGKAQNFSIFAGNFPPTLLYSNTFYSYTANPSQRGRVFILYKYHSLPISYGIINNVV